MDTEWLQEVACTDYDEGRVVGIYKETRSRKEHNKYSIILSFFLGTT